MAPYSLRTSPSGTSFSIREVGGGGGGGGFVVDSARIRINNSFLLHFTTEGILIQGGLGTFVSSCFLGQHSTAGSCPGERDFSGTAIDLWSNDNAITDVLFSAAIVVLLRGQSNIPLGVLNVVMGKAPDIGDASCASPEVFCPSSIFFSVLFMIAQHCPGQSNWTSKRDNVDISCFIHLVQVRKITFTGSTAVGKKLMAGAAGTVKRVCTGC
ncbi:hypothetical protein POTOM_031323 [Populus tomentosa]|uniref:Uncharacterized protein n=1 Tax=Populus tomentosa TaxID=118781 RepID=A0A8X8CSF5_POPTO|nr:hypothetical protein POTOM_031323 [Populus tomentosa]